MTSDRSATDLQSLRTSVRGEVFEPGDAGFDAAREVWNTRFDSRPDVIVRCAQVADVATTINYVRERHIPLTVKSGGHDYAGNSAARGGLLLDLSAMNEIQVDAAANRVRVGAGARWAQVDAATQVHGLATTGGTVSTVGVAGFTLGGGDGWLTRKAGLALDNLRSAEVVTAAGDVLEVSSESHPDLFWAIRGGSGNFGVVTRLDLALHPVGPELMAGQVLYPFDRAPELLRFYRDTMRAAPDELCCYAFILRIPPIPVFPEAFHGQLALDFVLAYAGDLAEGVQALAPFRAHGDPILDAVGQTRYLDLQQSFDAGMGAGSRWYSRSCYFDEMTDAALDALVANIGALPGAFTTVYLGAGGGAAGRVDPAATAFPHRGAEAYLHVFPGWTDADQDHGIMEWSRGLYSAMAPHGNGGVYVNLLGGDEEAGISRAYGPNLTRLAALKAEWDPGNLFRHNHNIAPAT